jgi:hypothetical protein
MNPSKKQPQPSKSPTATSTSSHNYSPIPQSELFPGPQPQLLTPRIINTSTSNEVTIDIPESQSTDSPPPSYREPSTSNSSAHGFSTTFLVLETLFLFALCLSNLIVYHMGITEEARNDVTPYNLFWQFSLPFFLARFVCTLIALVFMIKEALLLLDEECYSKSEFCAEMKRLLEQRAWWDLAGRTVSIGVFAGFLWGMNFA